MNVLLVAIKDHSQQQEDKEEWKRNFSSTNIYVNAYVKVFKQYL